ncbi:MAG: hypothetical protein CMJ83_17955 [Planctomycetes bacterium]|nr:hypothetical protein [Planctomycetota bacterium]
MAKRDDQEQEDDPAEEQPALGLPRQLPTVREPHVTCDQRGRREWTDVAPEPGCYGDQHGGDGNQDVPEGMQARNRPGQQEHDQPQPDGPHEALKESPASWMILGVLGQSHLPTRKASANVLGFAAVHPPHSACRG